jgi:hypothetical protein
MVQFKFRSEIFKEKQRDSKLTICMPSQRQDHCGLLRDNLPSKQQEVPGFGS